MSLQVLEAYGHITLQGMPVYGLRRFGVPPGGAFDQESHAIANALAGNDADALTLEIAMGAMRICANRNCSIGISGARCTILPEPHNGQLTLAPGEDISIEPPTEHARVYLAIAGGFAKRSSGEPIRAGALLKTLSPESSSLNTASNSSRTLHSLGSRPIGVIPFATDHVPTEMLRVPFKVSFHSDRVGVRLDEMKFDPGHESLSEPACPGTIQVTNDGTLVIHGPDGPTLGGYRKIGVVCSADMNLIAQLRPGGTCKFIEITKREAFEKLRNRV